MTWKTMTGREPGWYRDPAPSNPSAPDTLRYWDGANWTAQTRVASRQERRAWLAEAAAASHAEEQQLVERARAGDVQAQLQLDAAAAATSRSTTPDGAMLAGWWVRVAAHLVDGVLVLILGCAFSWPFLKQIATAYREFFDATFSAVQAGSTPPGTAELEAAVAGPLVWVAVTFLLVGFVYEVGFLKAYQATPGKMLLGLEVRLRERPGPMPWGTVLLRWTGKNGVGLVQLVPFFGPLAYTLYVLLDYLWPLWDPHRQAIHDKLAGTNVVRRG